MKKLCVVTWSGGTNYGTNLQAYALVKKLSKMGYDVKLKGSIRGNFNYLRYPAFVLNRIWFKIKQKVSAVKKRREVIDVVKQKKFQNFCNECLPMLNSQGKTEWLKIEKEYLAFITGSDQVWNPNYFHSSAMLDFVKTDKIKKIAYAPSIGVNSLSSKMQRIYKRLLASYSAIGMRELQAVELIRDISPVSVEVVLDPTLLLKKEDWDSFAEGMEVDDEILNIMNESYILCYFVGTRRNYGAYVNLIRKATGLKCIVIPMEMDMSSCGQIAMGIGPKEFVGLIKNASIVCTDSFHATAFSIIYQKEFYVLKRFNDNSLESQNGRLYEVLDTYNLRERWITNEEKFHRKSQIDYSIVQSILEQNRKNSEKFLISALAK